MDFSQSQGKPKTAKVSSFFANERLTQPDMRKRFGVVGLTVLKVTFRLQAKVGEV